MNYKEKLLEKENPIILALVYLFKCILLSILVAVPMGLLASLFLNSLNFVTSYRESNHYIIILLPLGGALVAYLYKNYGGSSSKGNNLIIEQIEYMEENYERVPKRLTPLVLLGTLITHLFGGSAGREGTALQMGGSVADSIASLLKLSKEDRKILLLCGIAAGFGAVFGTPIAGAVFAIEVAVIGSMHTYALIPCFLSAYLSNILGELFGATHTHYEILGVPEHFTLEVFIKILIASAVFGLCSLVFSKSLGALKKSFTKLMPNPIIKSFIGGLLIVILIYISNGWNFIGLGVPTIVDSLKEPLPLYYFLLKIIFTVLTLSFGFQGGEVTPLFFIGSTLGNSLGQLLGISPLFLAGLGFIAVFSGATNTPLACFIMGIELFHGQGAEYLFIAALVSYLFSGHNGIYSSQSILKPKYPWIKLEDKITLGNYKKENP